jgi:hypothetical protein
MSPHHQQQPYSRYLFRDREIRILLRKKKKMSKRMRKRTMRKKTMTMMTIVMMRKKMINSLTVSSQREIIGSAKMISLKMRMESMQELMVWMS